MDRYRIEQYAIMAYVISNLREETEKVKQQAVYNQFAVGTECFTILENLESAFNALDEALTDLNDERKAYISSVDEVNT